MKKMDLSKRPYRESCMGVSRHSTVYRKGKGGLKRRILFKSHGCFPKESAVLEISNTFDILGILSEQTRFSITVHRFRDPLNSFRIPFRYSQTSGSWSSALWDLQKSCRCWRRGPTNNCKLSIFVLFDKTWILTATSPLVSGLSGDRMWWNFVAFSELQLSQSLYMSQRLNAVYSVFFCRDAQCSLDCHEQRTSVCEGRTFVSIRVDIHKTTTRGGNE
jgi:hypothetical protein